MNVSLCCSQIMNLLGFADLLPPLTYPVSNATSNFVAAKGFILICIEHASIQTNMCFYYITFGRVWQHAKYSYWAWESFAHQAEPSRRNIGHRSGWCIPAGDRSATELGREPLRRAVRTHLSLLHGAHIHLHGLVLIHVH
jgi:hypothetical protein